MPSGAQSFPDAAELAADRGEDLEIVQCARCGLVQLDGAPVPYFREVIRAAAFSPEMGAFREAQFRRWADECGLTGKRVLEIGCGRGEYLRLMRGAGMEAEGLEYAPAAVRACHAEGLPVQRGYLTRPGQRLKAAPYDGFVTLNFIEHWPNPVASLRAMANNLVPGGIGLVEAPNFDMILRQGLFSEFIRDHLLYFTEETLRFTLNQAGFEVLDCRPVWHDYILSARVRKRAALDVSGFETRRRELTQGLRAFIGQFPPGQVAVWGAGHQALAVLALAEIGGQIGYIVDSAPFKQGRYSPATHRPIVPPETLDSDPVEAVIVMAASYSDEVAGIVRSRFDASLKLAILRDWGLEIA